MPRWGQALRRVRVVAAAAAVTLLVSLGAGVAAAGSANADDDVSCPDVVVIGARGSGEAPKLDDGDLWIHDPHHNIGVQLDSVYSRFTSLYRQKYPKAWVEVIGVEYAAYPVDYLFNSKALQSQYTGSMLNGSDQAFAALQSVMARPCVVKPQIVLMGYSQGAMVMTDAINRLVMTGNSLKQIRQVTFIGDPLYQAKSGFAKGPAKNANGMVKRMFVNGQNGNNVFSQATGKALDAFQLVPLAKDLPTTLKGRSADWCNAGDLMCDWTVKTVPTCIAALKTLELISQCPHVHYDETNVVDAAARLMLKSVKNVQPEKQYPELAITTTELPSGTVGDVYEAQVLATGGTPPVTFAAGANWPKWLTITPSGALFGIPPTAGSQKLSVLVGDAKTALTRNFAIDVTGKSEAVGVTVQGTARVGVRSRLHVVTGCEGASFIAIRAVGGFPTNANNKDATQDFDYLFLPNNDRQEGAYGDQLVKFYASCSFRTGDQVQSRDVDLGVVRYAKGLQMRRLDTNRSVSAQPYNISLQSVDPCPANSTRVGVDVVSALGEEQFGRGFSYFQLSDANGSWGPVVHTDNSIILQEAAILVQCVDSSGQTLARYTPIMTYVYNR